ncbi:PAS domain S-box-containing protein [Mariniflexile fucanivorans]|uniref:histidine kinase n=1 Tax=Mariniflexile fucanivorans TaxID=264023 RepID=A0A4R1RDQ9_9FLAO|nr:PAS domain-containing sensor histidine kinase [Mariniflexile fucanivorans]TCL64018.1 PAS domain S-box-containing protein [Mariniflexile fucanivorans]
MTNVLEKEFTIGDIVYLNSSSKYNELTSQFALENCNTGVWDFHINTNTVNYSKEAKNILGISDDSLANYHWKKSIHPEDIDQLLSNLNSHYNGKTLSYISEHRIKDTNDKYKWVKETGRVVEKDTYGNPIRIIGIICDITERKEKEVALSLNLNIITNQNSRLQNFAHIVTHNLKQYAGNFESLLEFYNTSETEEEKKELIGLLETVSKSLSKTIGSLNEIVSKQLEKKLERKNLNIHHFIENTIKFLELEISNKKAIINNNVDSDIFIYSNRTYLESIIQNLASNALKYCHPDRALILNIDSHLTESGLLTITVADNGIGIDLEKYGDAVFGLYRTFHGNTNAEGVGLYLTKRQVETLGGHIEIKSIVNEGTTFTITMNTKKSS